jgi:hypothetical protein
MTTDETSEAMLDTVNVVGSATPLEPATGEAGASEGTHAVEVTSSDELADDADAQSAPMSAGGKPKAKRAGVRILPGVRVGPVGRLLAKILEHYPKRGEIYVTSAYRNEAGSHHGGLMYKDSPTAGLDIAAGSAAKMRDVAKWLYDRFAGSTVELIHTTPFANDQGFYVWHQRKYPNGGGIYDAKTMADHRDHVHFATSKALAQKILAELNK